MQSIKCHVYVSLVAITIALVSHKDIPVILHRFDCLYRGLFLFALFDTMSI